MTFIIVLLAFRWPFKSKDSSQGWPSSWCAKEDSFSKTSGWGTRPGGAGGGGGGGAALYVDLPVWTKRCTMPVTPRHLSCECQDHMDTWQGCCPMFSDMWIWRVPGDLPTQSRSPRQPCQRGARLTGGSLLEEIWLALGRHTPPWRVSRYLSACNCPQASGPQGLAPGGPPGRAAGFPLSDTRVDSSSA